MCAGPGSRALQSSVPSSQCGNPRRHGEETRLLLALRREEGGGGNTFAAPAFAPVRAARRREPVIQCHLLDLYDVRHVRASHGVARPLPVPWESLVQALSQGSAAGRPAHPMSPLGCLSAVGQGAASAQASWHLRTAQDGFEQGPRGFSFALRPQG